MLDHNCIIKGTIWKYTLRGWMEAREICTSFKVTRQLSLSATANESGGWKGVCVWVCGCVCVCVWVCACGREKRCVWVFVWFKVTRQLSLSATVNESGGRRVCVYECACVCVRACVWEREEVCVGCVWVFVWFKVTRQLSLSATANESGG